MDFAQDLWDLAIFLIFLYLLNAKVVEVDKLLHQICTANLGKHCVLLEDAVVLLMLKYAAAKDPHTIFYFPCVKGVAQLVVTLLMHEKMNQQLLVDAFRLYFVCQGKLAIDVD